MKQGTYELLAQCNERFREMYCVYKESSSITGITNGIEEANQAMDFFHGLYQAGYGMFKKSMLNG
jgi:hypothetical protein